jgi:hypothetical protein
MLSDRVQGRIVVINTGDRLATVTLATSEVGTGRVNVAGFWYVAVLAAPPPIELNSPVGVRQARANTHLGGNGAVREDAPFDPGNFHKGALTTGKHLIFFIVTGAGLTFLIAPDGRGDLFLSGGRLRQEKQYSKYG